MEQTERITAQVLEHPKLRKLSDEEKDDLKPLILRYVRRVLLQIKAHCNRDDVPEALEEVAAEITEDLLFSDKIITEDKEISSISRGDTSISYRNPASAYQKADDFMKNYECQLVHFKRMKLPSDPRDERS